MGEEREEKQGRVFGKSEEEKQDEQAEKDAEGHGLRYPREDESEDDEGKEEGKEEGRYISDARLKQSVEPVGSATGRPTAPADRPNIVPPVSASRDTM